MGRGGGGDGVQQRVGVSGWVAGVTSYILDAVHG